MATAAAATAEALAAAAMSRGHAGASAVGMRPCAAAAMLNAGESIVIASGLSTRFWSVTTALRGIALAGAAIASIAFLSGAFAYIAVLGRPRLVAVAPLGVLPAVGIS